MVLVARNIFGALVYMGLLPGIIVLSSTAINNSFWARFQFSSSLSHYVIPSSKLQPNGCMAQSTPACGAPVPLTMASGCVQKCHDPDSDGGGGFRRILQIAKDRQQVDRRRLLVCACEYDDEYPAYPTDVLTGGAQGFAGCPAEMQSLLTSGACTCDAPIHTAFALCLTGGIFSLMPPAIWMISKVVSSCTPDAFQKCMAGPILLLSMCCLVGLLLFPIIAAIFGQFVVGEARVEICGDGGLGDLNIVVIMSWILATLVVSFALAISSTHMCPNKLCKAGLLGKDIPVVSAALARLKAPRLASPAVEPITVGLKKETQAQTE